MASFRVYDERQSAATRPTDENATRVHMKSAAVDAKKHGRVALADISRQNVVKQQTIAPSPKSNSDAGYGSTRTDSTNASNIEDLVSMPSILSYASMDYAQPSTSSLATAPTITKPGQIRHYEPALSDSGMNMSIDEASSTNTATFHTAREQTALQHAEEIVFGCAEYADTIYAYTVQQALRYLPSKYLSKQIEITEHMRAILVDWIVDVAIEFNMQAETFHKAVGYIDRFLSKRSVYKRHLQLVGTAAIMIAAKYEEIYPPETAEYVEVTDNSYSASQVKSMERRLLVELDYVVSNPTAYHFLGTFAAAQRLPERVALLAEYLLVLSAIDYSFVAVPMHMIAAAACALANMMNYREAWPEEMTSKFDIEEAQLRELVVMLHEQYLAAPNRTDLKAAFEKYSSEQLHHVALTMACDELLKESTTTFHFGDQEMASPDSASRDNLHSALDLSERS